MNCLAPSRFFASTPSASQRFSSFWGAHAPSLVPMGAPPVAFSVAAHQTVRSKTIRDVFREGPSHHTRGACATYSNYIIPAQYIIPITADGRGWARMGGDPCGSPKLTRRAFPQSDLSVKFVSFPLSVSISVYP